MFHIRICLKEIREGALGEALADDLWESQEEFCVACREEPQKESPGVIFEGIWVESLEESMKEFVKESWKNSLKYS